MATRTRVATVVQSRADAAAKIVRKFRGDMQSANRMYEFWPVPRMLGICHDIELGIAHNCISHVDLNFYDSKREHVESYRYKVCGSAGLVASGHSGRIDYNPRIAGGQGQVLVHPSDYAIWRSLKRKREWSSGTGPDLDALVGIDDGAYVAGQLGLTRKKYGA